MTAKQRLEHVRICNQGIQILSAGLKELYLSVEGLKASRHGRATWAPLLDVSAEYVREIQACREEIQNTIGQIESIGNPVYREVLKLRYLNDKPIQFSQIAGIMHRSEGGTRHLHMAALKAFERGNVENDKA